MIEADLLQRALSGRILGIYEPSLRAMLAALPARMEADLRLDAPKAARVKTAGAGGAGLVAVIPIHGVIEQRGGFMSMFFGGTSCDQLTDQLRQAVNDPSVGAIVLDIDSPGGDVAGIEELAQEIYNARKLKPITAVSNTLCASAAYYLGSQASELIASPSSLTGSIGVYTTHEDDSKALDNMGVKFTLLHFGENKTEGNSFEPLSDSARAHMQDMVDGFGAQFEKAVARGRGVKQDDVHKKFGQGRVFDAKKAVSLGMADRVGTFDDALAKHGAARPSGMRGCATSWASFSAEGKKTKRVDDEDLEKSAFGYQGSDELADWKLPIKFSTEEKTLKHVRNAISRWGSTDMPNAEEKKKARSRIKAAAKAHDIDVDDDSLAQAKKKSDVGEPDDASADNDDCQCPCEECEEGDCDSCSHAGCDCDGCTCAAATEGRKKAHSLNRRRVELAAL